MMEQLIKVTSVPFQAIHFTQNARLVPADNMALERTKALARHRALQLRCRAAAGSIDFDYINKVKAAFSDESKSSRKAAPVVKQPGGPHLAKHNQTASVSSQNLPSPDGQAPYSGRISPYRAAQEADVSAAGQQPVPSVPAPSEASAAYTVQRGSFELRVAKGELSYVPPLVMTVITQYPDIHFEYTGGFNYIPPREDSSGVNMNLSI